MGYGVTSAIGAAELKNFADTPFRADVTSTDYIHTDAVYNALINAAGQMLQQWNLALTTMTNINKNMGDALNSIASNFR